VRIADDDAVFVTGGQSPMVMFRGEATLQKLGLLRGREDRGPRVPWHLPAARDETVGRELLVDGKTWTGFANSEEPFADSFVGMRIQPFWIEDEARRTARDRPAAELGPRRRAARRGGAGAMRIASFGYGNVGAPLAGHLQRLGHEVTLAAADPGSDGVKVKVVYRAPRRAASRSRRGGPLARRPAARRRHA
jgi:hypothetical protein